MHRYRLAAPPDAVWAALASVGDYPSWWPWLRSFDARALAAGEAWRCTIRPPLPYAVRCTIALGDVDAGLRVAADVSGDVTGAAAVTLVGAPDRATDVRIASDLTARSLPARAVSRVAPGVARRGHDWVFDTAAAQFARAHGWVVTPLPAVPPAGAPPLR